MATRALRLPLTFDPGRLVQDLRRCLATEWPGHFNQRDYSGTWTSIALRSATGSPLDITSVPDQAGYRDTTLMAICPYFAVVLAAFECHLETVRLLRLGAGSAIHEHRDPGASYADGFLRLHVPITTNAETRFMVDGQALDMRPGECWYADFGLPHSVTNAGTTDRVHLVIDGTRNGWTDALFSEAGYDFAADEQARQMDPETTRQVIAALRARGTETDLRLAAELEGRVRPQ